LCGSNALDARRDPRRLTAGHIKRPVEAAGLDRACAGAPEARDEVGERVAVAVAQLRRRQRRAENVRDKDRERSAAVVRFD